MRYGVDGELIQDHSQAGADDLLPGERIIDVDGTSLEGTREHRQYDIDKTIIWGAVAVIALCLWASFKA